MDLMAQVAELESLKMRLSSEEDKYSASNVEVERLKADNCELSNDMDSCRKKEAELLEFTQKLTESNVTLQSECQFIEARASTLEAEHTRLTNKGLNFMHKLILVVRESSKSSKLSKSSNA